MPRPALATVYGGGGVYGTNFSLSVATVLAAGGVPLRDSPALGTSAGSWVASAVALGVSLEEVQKMPPVRVPSYRPGYLRSMAASVFGNRYAPTVSSVTCCTPFWQRTLLSGAELPVPDLVAASSSVPGLFTPVRSGARLQVDGGVRSIASADLAPEAENLLVIAPVCDPVLGPLGRAVGIQLRYEMRRWESRTGGRAHLVTPSREVLRVLPRVWSIFDVPLAERVAVAARSQVERLLDEDPALAALCNL